MGRPIGSKHPDYERKRAALAEAALPRLLADGGETSLNELAEAIGVSVPTLKHYFGDRSGLVAAAWRRQAELARPHLQNAATPSANDLETSLRDFLSELVRAWRAFGVGRVFAVGLGSGLHDAAVGPAYLDGVLEPTLQALERRLRRHAELGQLRVRAADGEGLRAAALVLLSPVVLALLHQDALGGATCRALDVDAFVEFHLAGFLRAQGAGGGAARRAR